MRRPMAIFMVMLSVTVHGIQGLALREN